MSTKGINRKSVVFLIKRRMHGLRRVFFLGLVLASALGAYFHLEGFPSWAVRLLERNLAERDLFVSIEKVKLDFYYGFAAQEVTVFKTILCRKPLLKAESVSGYVSGKTMWPGRRLLAHMHVENARIEPEPNEKGLMNPLAWPQLRSLDAEWSPGLLNVVRSDLRWEKLRANASGEFFYDRESLASIKERSSGQSPNELMSFFAKVCKAVRLKDPANLELRFAINTLLPEHSSLNVELDGSRVLIRDIFFSDFDGSFSLTPEFFRVHELILKNGTDFLTASGSVELKDYRTAFKIENTLELQDLALMHSVGWMKWVTDQKLDLEEGFQLTVKTGEGDWLKRKDVSATFFAKKLGVRGIDFQNVYSSLKHEDGIFVLPRMRAFVRGGTIPAAGAARQAHGGPVTADGLFDPKTKAYRLRTTLGFDPGLALPLVEKTPLERIVRNHEFFEEVELDLLTEGVWGTSGSTALSGRLKAGRAARRGAEVDAVQCEFSYKDSVLALPSVHVEKEGASNDGTVLVNFSTDIIDLDVAGGVDPNIMAQMIHPVVARPFRLFEFNGENYVQCKGTVDYGDGSKTRLSGVFRGTDIRSPVADVERASFDFGMTGYLLYFTNINAQVYGGTCTGESSFVLRGTDRPYRAEMTADKVGVKGLVNFYGGSSDQDNLGLLNGQVVLQGEVGRSIRRNIRGQGSARIEEGWLVELPVLKSFTKAARLVFNKFSTFSQTDCTMDFTIRDGAVYSENLVLAGDLMTLNGAGQYDFDSGFDANVEMTPFRKNKLTRVVQWASTPFSELLQFRVEGPLSNPTWNLSRIPDVGSMFRSKGDEAADDE